jgi:hypothetical protein
MLALAGGWLATPAKADGDPASDVLATEQLFLPQDAAVPVAQQEQLARVLQAAAASGYPIRVAIVASPTDLGSVTALWRQPQNYAQFLGQELALTYHRPLLVVMPNGFGLYHFNGPSTAERSLLPAISSREGLGVAALTAVQALAREAGHPLALAQGAPSATATGDNTTAWIAFAAGTILIGIAWAASLRARPLRPRGTRTSPS